MVRALQLGWLLALLPLFVPGNSYASPSPASLARLTIQLSDLRPGYMVARTEVRTAVTLTSEDRLGAPLLLAHGWIGGFDALFKQARQPGIQVGETVDRFRGAGGAHWWYEVSLFRVPAGYQPIEMSRVGEESAAIQSGEFVGIIFRRDALVVDVYVSLQATSARTSVLALARLLDRRLKQDRRPAAAAKQSPLALRVWLAPNPVRYGANVTVYARTVPGALCTDQIQYSGRHSRPARNTPRLVGREGMVSWSWRDRVRRIGGSATVACSFKGWVRRVTVRFTAPGQRHRRNSPSRHGSARSNRSRRGRTR